MLIWLASGNRHRSKDQIYDSITEAYAKASGLQRDRCVAMLHNHP